jgi:hypothetical protein
MLSELAASEGRTLTTGLAAEGGRSLGEHANSAATTSLLESANWDYVILQEESVIPSLADHRDKYMCATARVLDAAITAGGAETLLFMTCGRENGMADECLPRSPRSRTSRRLHIKTWEKS